MLVEAVVVAAIKKATDMLLLKSFASKRSVDDAFCM
jgi:hypothetical protein